MQQLIGLLFILGGIALGIYVGVWLMFIGGIIGLIEAIRATTVVPMDVAISVAKIVFAGFVGQITGMIPVVIGKALIE